MKNIIKKIIFYYKTILESIKTLLSEKFLSRIFLIIFIAIFIYQLYPCPEMEVNFDEDIKKVESLKAKYKKPIYNETIVENNNDNKNEKVSVESSSSETKSNDAEKKSDDKETSPDNAEYKIDFDNIEYVTYTNDRFNFSAEYPSFLEEQEIAKWPLNAHCSQFLSKGNEIFLEFSGYNNALSKSTEEMFNSRKENIDEEISYEALFDKSFVLSWEKDGYIFYTYTVVGTSSYDGFTISYRKELEEELNAIIEHIYKSFKAENTDNAY